MALLEALREDTAGDFPYRVTFLRRELEKLLDWLCTRALLFWSGCAGKTIQRTNKVSSTTTLYTRPLLQSVKRSRWKKLHLSYIRIPTKQPSAMPPRKQKQAAFTNASTENIPSLPANETAMVLTKTGEEETHTPERSPAKRGPMTITEAQKQALMDNLQLESRTTQDAYQGLNNINC